MAMEAASQIVRAFMRDKNTRRENDKYMYCTKAEAADGVRKEYTTRELRSAAYRNKEMKG